MKERERQIPWMLLKGMRNRLIHEYFGTDLTLNWNIIKHELPSLESDLRKIKSQLDTENM